MSLTKKTKNTLLVLGIIFGLLAGVVYYFIFSGNVSIPAQEKEFLYIPTGASFEDVLKILNDKKLLRDEQGFVILSKSAGYTAKVLPGKYRLKNRMTNFELVRLLKSGKQEPVKLVIRGSQSMDNFLEYVSANLEISYEELNQKFNDNDYLKQYNLKKETAPCLILPNTYEMYWNVSLPKFMEKMSAAYQKYWTEAKELQCKEAGLTKTEAVTLASIVEFETDKENDMPIIAGVYLNRLSKGMRLQADPTVKFAMNDITSKRVYKKMLDFDSPYNTYKNKGLPPGPICIPSLQALNAVLNYQKHNFIYFCARADGSGYSEFAENYNDHRVNAKKYQRYLDEKNVR